MPRPDSSRCSSPLSPYDKAALCAPCASQTSGAKAPRAAGRLARQSRRARTRRARSWAAGEERGWELSFKAHQSPRASRRRFPGLPQEEVNLRRVAEKAPGSGYILPTMGRAEMCLYKNQSETRARVANNKPELSNKKARACCQCRGRK